MYGFLFVIFLVTFLFARTLPIYNDDAFITFRYAQNLAERGEIAYNPGEHVLGTTSPLLMLLIALARSVGFDLVSSGQCVLAFSLALATVFLWIMFKDIFGYMGAFAACVALVLHPEIHDFWGNEIPLMFLFIMLCLFFLKRKRYTGAGVSAGLLYLVRGEGILLSVVIGFFLLLDVYRGQLKAANFVNNPLFRFIVPVIVIVGGWSLFSLAYFGSVFPNTLSRKILQGRHSHLWIPFLKGLWQLSIHHFTGQMVMVLSRLFIVIFILGAVTFVINLPKSRVLQIVSAYTVLQISLYAILNVPGTYRWYYYMVIFMEVLLIGAFLHLPTLIQEKINRPISTWVIGIQLVFLAILCISLVNPKDEKYYEVRYEMYKKAMTGLRPYISEDTIVVCQEIGVVGLFYPAKCTIPSRWCTTTCRVTKNPT